MAGIQTTVSVPRASFCGRKAGQVLHIQLEPDDVGWRGMLGLMAAAVCTEMNSMDRAGPNQERTARGQAFEKQVAHDVSLVSEGRIPSRWEAHELAVLFLVAMTASLGPEQLGRDGCCGQAVEVGARLYSISLIRMHLSPWKTHRKSRVPSVGLRTHLLGVADSRLMHCIVLQEHRMLSTLRCCGRTHLVLDASERVHHAPTILAGQRCAGPC